MQDLACYYPDRHMLQYTFHISQSPAFVYVNNAKCGCTTAKASLNQWHAAWNGSSLTYKNAGEIHERDANLLLRPGQVGETAQDVILHSPGYLRITLFRDPLTRIASAYASKMSWNTRERQLFNRTAGRDANENVPYSLFVRLICNDPAFRDNNEHWRLQTRQIAADLINYDFICLQETLRTDLLKVRERVFPGLSLDVFDAGKAFPSNKSFSSHVLEQMTDTEVEMIRETYEDDFAFYKQVLKSRGDGGIPFAGEV